eukprot:COSAG01_NODE_34154_length_552_cov_0.969095_1_plen_76_part_00
MSSKRKYTLSGGEPPQLPPPEGKAAIGAGKAHERDVERAPQVQEPALLNVKHPDVAVGHVAELTASPSTAAAFSS